MITNNNKFIDGKEGEENVQSVTNTKYRDLNFKELMKDRKNFSAIVFGKRRSGKSILIKDLFSQIWPWYKEAYVFSETIDMQPDLFDYIPTNNRFNSFDQEKMQEIWDNQKKYMVNSLKYQKDKSKLDHILMIFDDVIQDSHIRNSQIFNRLYTAGRHNNIAVVVLSQQVGGKEGINSVCRRNSDLIVTYFLESDYDRDILADQFLSGSNSKKVGKELISEITRPEYQCMCLDVTSTKRDYADFIYTYKAKTDVPSFIIGRNSMINDLEIKKSSKGVGVKAKKETGGQFQTAKEPIKEPYITLSDGRQLSAELQIGFRMKQELRRKNLL